MREAPAQAEHSIPELLQRLASETSLLVRQEVALARAEIVTALQRLAPGAAMVAGGALLALGAFGALTALLVIAIGLALPLWSAALIVTALYGVAAGVAVRSGVSTLKSAGAPVPRQTVATVKEDVATIESSIRRGR